MKRIISINGWLVEMKRLQSDPSLWVALNTYWMNPDGFNDTGHYKLLGNKVHCAYSYSAISGDWRARFLNHKLHSLHACTRNNYEKKWTYENRSHREDGPSYVGNRLDGPVVKYWYLYGIELTKIYEDIL